jgi:hypothetical protein
MYKVSDLFVWEGIMNTFLIGIVAGFVMFGVVAAVALVYKMHQEITRLATSTEALHKAVQLLFMKVTKIEKVSITTMNAAETFVDALRASAEQMMMRPPHRIDGSDNFDDLKRSFEDGIKGFESDVDDEEDEDGERKEDWNK